jgi:hypothetical protein
MLAAHSSCRSSTVADVVSGFCRIWLTDCDALVLPLSDLARLATTAATATTTPPTTTHPPTPPPPTSTKTPPTPGDLLEQPDGTTSANADESDSSSPVASSSSSFYCRHHADCNSPLERWVGMCENGRCRCASFTFLPLGQPWEPLPDPADRDVLRTRQLASSPSSPSSSWSSSVLRSSSSSFSTTGSRTLYGEDSSSVRPLDPADEVQLLGSGFSTTSTSTRTSTSGLRNPLFSAPPQEVETKTTDHTQREQKDRRQKKRLTRFCVLPGAPGAPTPFNQSDLPNAKQESTKNSEGGCVKMRRAQWVE